MNVCELLGCVTGYVLTRAQQKKYIDDVTLSDIHEVVRGSSAIDVAIYYADLFSPIDSDELVAYIKTTPDIYPGVMSDILGGGATDTVPTTLSIKHTDLFGQALEEMYTELSTMITDGEVTTLQGNYIKAIQWVISKADEDLLTRSQSLPH